jgi:hypothetical protein
MLVRGSCSAYGTFAAARLQPWSLVRLFSPVAAERFERRFGCEHVSRADLPEARLIERGIGVLPCCFDSFSARRAVAEQHDNVPVRIEESEIVLVIHPYGGLTAEILESVRAHFPELDVGQYLRHLRLPCRHVIGVACDLMLAGYAADNHDCDEYKAGYPFPRPFVTGCTLH